MHDSPLPYRMLSTTKRRPANNTVCCHHAAKYRTLYILPLAKVVASQRLRQVAFISVPRLVSLYIQSWPGRSRFIDGGFMEVDQSPGRKGDRVVMAVPRAAEPQRLFEEAGAPSPDLTISQRRQ